MWAKSKYRLISKKFDERKNAIAAQSKARKEKPGKVGEKVLEKRLVKRVNDNGGLCLKFTSPSYTGVPDRICLFWKGIIKFVEVKTTGNKPTMRQLFIHKLLRRLGFEVWVVDSYESLEKFIESI